jgi:hypothetical protein
MSGSASIVVEGGFRSDHSAVGAQDLALDPGAVRAAEESDGGSDVLGR